MVDVIKIWNQATCQPGAKSAAVGANVVERGLSRVCLLFPLPFVDDEPPLEMGQEFQVFLLLCHTHHLKQTEINMDFKYTMTAAVS